MILGPLSRARRNEHGLIAAEWAGAIGLIFLPITLLVLSVPQWSARQLAARVATREAARAMALSSSIAEGRADGEVVANQVMDNHGLKLGADYEPVQFETGDPEVAGSIVKTSMEVKLPMFPVFGVGSHFMFPVSIRHSEPVDQYRDPG